MISFLKYKMEQTPQIRPISTKKSDNNVFCTHKKALLLYPPPYKKV